MSGDSTFGNSNIAAASSLSDPGERDENEPLEKLQESSQASTNSALDQSANTERQKSDAAIIAKVLSNFGDSVNGALPDSPEKRSTRWRQKLSTRGKDAAQKAKEAEQLFNLTDDSIDDAEQRFKNRRRPFTRNENQKDREKKWREAAAAALNDTNESQEAEQIVYKKPRSFSQRVHALKNKIAGKQVTQNVNAFDVTDSSVEEQQTRVTRGFSKKCRTSSKGRVNPDYFDVTDESLVVDKPPVRESKKRRFSRYERKITDADINALDVSDEEEEADGCQGEEELVLKLDEEAGAGRDNGRPEEEGANNSMDESGDEADHDNRNQTLEIQSPVEVAGGEDSLDEEVDEAEMESRKSDRIVSNECEEDDKVEKQKDAVAAEGGSCSEQSSLLLEYQLSIDNHSESRVIVTESHNRSASLVNNTSKTVEITMAARGSRRFTQHGSQFLDVEDRVKSLHNFGTSFDGFVNVLNVSSTSGKKSLGPVEGENSRISPVKATPESDSNNTSLPSQNNSVNKNGKRSFASKELFCDRTSSSNKDTSGNNSKQNLNDSIGVLDASMQPLDVEEREMNRSLRRGEDSANRSSKKKNIVTNYSKQTNKSRENLLDDSVASNRSLRSRTRGESNKSVIDDESKTNEESRDGLLMGVINESPKEANEVRGINRSLRNRTGNSSNNMSETEGSKENSKSGNDIHDFQKEERGNSRSLRNESRGNKNKSITEKESSDVSMDVVNESQQGVGELENSKRSLRNKSGRRDEDGLKENEKKGEVSINVSKQGLNEADGVERSLRDTSAAKILLNKSVTEDRFLKERRRESSNKSSTEEASSKENNVQEEADEERGNNRSLRNRSVAKGKSNRNVSGDQNSKKKFEDSFNSVHDSVGFVSNARTRRASMVASKDETGESSPDENAENISDSLRSSVGANRSRSRNNSRLVDRVSPGAGSAEVGDGSPETVSGGRDAINGVTYSSEEIVGQKRGTSLLYNSLDTFSEEHRSSVSMLQIPHNRNESAMINNSLDSTVNATRHDPIPSDEMMPAPRSLPARKRRLANVDTPSFSSLTQKKKKTVAGETDSIVGLVEKQNDQVAVNNNREVMVTKVDYKCPKLKKPEPWATKRLYDWIIQRLEPRYKLRSRLRAEEFVVFLCSTVKTVIKKKENYEKDIEDLKYEMARLNLIENKFQFFSFIYKFLPWQFEDKSLPLPQSFITHTGPLVTFEKGTLYDPIL